jgi:hypothetical protein
MRDQCLGRQAALDDARRCRRLHGSRLAGATAIARTTRYQDAEARGHHVEPLGNILANDVQRAAAARTGRALDPDHLLHALEMSGKPTAVDVAAPGLAIRQGGLELGSDAGQSRLGVLEREAQLIFGQLLRAHAEAVSLEGDDDAAQPLDLGIGLGTDGPQRGDLLIPRDDLLIPREDLLVAPADLAARFDEHRLEQRRIIRKLGLDQHGPSESAPPPLVNQRSAERSDDGSHARAASPGLREERRVAPRSDA